MGQMTLGKKIAMGFGIIVVIAAILGGLGVFNMNSAKDNAEVLAKERIPQVNISHDVSNEAAHIRYKVRGFAYIEDMNDLKGAKEDIERLKKALSEAKAHATKYNLPILKEQEEKASKALSEYSASLAISEKLQAERVTIRDNLSKDGGGFTLRIEEYLKDMREGAIENVNKGSNEDKDKAIERINKMGKLTNVLGIVYSARIQVQRARADRDTSLLDDAAKKLAAITIIDEVIKESVTKDIREKLETIKGHSTSYQKSIEAYIANVKIEAEENKKRVALGGAMVEAADASMDVGVKRSIEDSTESFNTLSAASTIMVVGLILAVVISIIIAVFIIRSITKPVTEAVKMIAEANTQVVSASDQIASSSTSLAEGASSQASSVEQVSATVEQSTAINNQNAENSREADSLAKAANEAARAGNHKIQELTKAMGKITESSQRIAKIIKTIDEIAFQTNLLALNAAVEAARAGEHGLGFAVVADEVKNLAQRSANAAKETAGIIEEAIEEIKNGNQIAKETSESFAEILEKAKKTSDLIGEITVSIKEQAEGMTQIATAMGQVDQVTQQNAANSEEAAAAAEELNAQAVAMMQSVDSIAKIVGFNIDMSLAHNSIGHSTTKRPQIKKIELHSSHKPMAKKPATRMGGKKDSDVFPLEEDDLKEF